MTEFSRIGLTRAAPMAAFWVFTILILLLSAWRLADLPHLPIWHDEAFTLVRVLGFPQKEISQALFSAQLLTPDRILAFQHGPAAPLSATLKALAEHPEHAPLYYLLARAALIPPLDPVTAVRGASAIAALFLPVTAFWLIQELFGRDANGRAKSWTNPILWPAPWFAALLVACSPIHLLYAQEARQYALWTVLTAAASAALVRALRVDRAGSWASYCLLIALGLYSHLLFALLIPVHLLYAGIREMNRPFDGWHEPMRRAQHLAMALGCSVLLFTPWLGVLVLRSEKVGAYTSWMERPLPTSEILLAWPEHLTRFFVDLSPEFVTATVLLLAPVLWGLVVFVRHAPRPAAWLPLLIALVYLAAVLGQDLVLGGSRSLHPRYALPVALSVQLMTAWALAWGSASSKPTTRLFAKVSIIALVIAGVFSLAAIHQADSWWTKNFSAANRLIAETINQSSAPLIVASPSGVATGELISLAYHLKPEVVIWGEGSGGRIPEGFAHYYALTPSATLMEALQPRQLEPLGDSWQWFRAADPITPATQSNRGTTRDPSSTGQP